MVCDKLLASKLSGEFAVAPPLLLRLTCRLCQWCFCSPEGCYATWACSIGVFVAVPPRLEPATLVPATLNAVPGTERRGRGCAGKDGSTGINGAGEPPTSPASPWWLAWC